MHNNPIFCISCNIQASGYRMQKIVPILITSLQLLQMIVGVTINLYSLRVMGNILKF